MRFLKTKIALAKASSSFKKLKHVEESPVNRTIFQESPKKRRRVVGEPLTPESTRSIKNIAKNFARAICNFSASKICLPYLIPLIEEKNVNLKAFLEYINGIKKYIDGLNKFRTSLIIQESDSEEVKSYKELFRKIGEVFIKYFSVNWIFSGKVHYKEAHLKYRFKMLRRIQQPELFTYIRKIGHFK